LVRDLCLLSSCSGIKRADLMPSDRKFSALPHLNQAGAKILYYASLAPSGHNSQPWFVKVVDMNEWIIGADPARRLPGVDPDNREVMLSIGAFVENLSLAAAALGFRAQTEVIAHNPFDEEIVKVSLKKARPNDYWLKRVITRRTVKHGQQQDELKSEVVQALSKPLKRHLFYFPRGTQHAKCIQEGVVEYFRMQLNRDVAQREMAKWTRLSDDDAKKYRDGLTVEGMEIGGIAGWYLRHFAHPSDFMKKSYRDRSLDYTAKLAAQGAGWFIVTSEGKRVSDLIETGRKFEKMALLAREHMVGIQPMTQWLEEETGVNEIASNHDPSVIPQFVLRVGYLNKYPNPLSLRRPVGWFLRT